LSKEPLDKFKRSSPVYPRLGSLTDMFSYLCTSPRTSTD